jgi:hypothetical protein
VWTEEKGRGSGTGVIAKNAVELKVDAPSVAVLC